MMIGSLLLFAAAHSPNLQPAEPAKIHTAKFAPTSGATARATASVRIVSGVRFGAGQSVDAPGAILRPAALTDQHGQQQFAKLLEFQ